MSAFTRIISGPVILAGRAATAIQPFFSSVPKG